MCQILKSTLLGFICKVRFHTDSKYNKSYLNLKYTKLVLHLPHWRMICSYSLFQDVWLAKRWIIYRTFKCTVKMEIVKCTIAEYQSLNLLGLWEQLQLDVSRITGNYLKYNQAIWVDLIFQRDNTFEVLLKKKKCSNLHGTDFPCFCGPAKMLSLYL